jgi:hypothetical protein
MVTNIAESVLDSGNILPIALPSPNASWTIDFRGPSMDCQPVSSVERNTIADNV